MPVKEITLDELLEGQGGSYHESRAKIMDSILAAVVRRYVPSNRKIDLDLTRTAELDLIITQVTPGHFKLKWEEVALDT